MKKIIVILISASMIFSAGVPTFAASTEETEQSAASTEEMELSAAPAEEAEQSAASTEETEQSAASEEETEQFAASAEETEPIGAEDQIHYIDNLSLELTYDDHYDLSELGEGISPNEEYVIYKTEYAAGQGITSCQVSQGKNTGEADGALLSMKVEEGVDNAGTGDLTEAIATGVGSGTIWLVRADQEEDLRKALEEGENSDEPINVYEIEVTVEPAALTLMFLAGQSNMEGYCDSYTGYDIGASIACEEGNIYSTYVPWGTSKGKEVTGIDFKEVCTTSNYRTTAGDFVAGSLQGAVTEEGVSEAPLNMTGGTLEYPLNSLTNAGGGKTGPDSGLAYEWNQLTADKVWVVNTAYGATEIAQWVPGGSCYERSVPIWNDVLETYQAEIDAGHYTEGSKLVFWQQGEMGDATNPATEYESYFDTMYQAMTGELGMDAFGFIMVRAGYATNKGADYRCEKDLKMSGSRIAQYWLGSGISPYSNVFVGSNANEQWVSDANVKSYFQSRYGGTLSYPVQSGKRSVPTTVNEVHYDIHYSQIGHNENGITAAEGIYDALTGSSAPASVSWRDADGQTVSSMKLELSTDTAIAVPVVEPAYTAKQLTGISASGNVVTYDAAAGVVQGASGSAIGTGSLVASAGRATGTLSVTISIPVDLSGIAGPNYTGLYLYGGVWWYLENGIIQTDYEGLVQRGTECWYVKNGRADFTYTGFLKLGDDCWYVEGGIVTLTTNSVIKDTAGAIGKAGTWYYVVGSEVQSDFTGLANYKNSNGWWYIENGMVNFNYEGFGKNKNGQWYIEGGKVTFEKQDIIKDTPGALGEKGAWYYVIGSQVQTSFTGLSNFRNSHGWWYIESGKVDFNHNGVDKNKNGWWYVTGGKVQFAFTGLANYRNANGWWYIQDGKVEFDHNGVDKNKNGWWYVTDSKVRFNFTGLADYRNSHGWWYIRDGAVDFDYTGIGNNKNGWWYIMDGKVDFGYTGSVTDGGISYFVSAGKVYR